MALLTLDDKNNIKLASAKKTFLEHLDAVEDLSPPQKAGFFNGVREANERFSVSSEGVLELYEFQDFDEALDLHIDEEHTISHELEAAMKELISEATAEAEQANDAFQSDKGFVTAMVWTFAGVSLAFALLVGFVMSWAFVRPVRRIESVVAGVAAGDFNRRVEVPNRDEFGTLSENVNRMSQRLGNLYDDMQHELTEHKRAEEELQRRAVEQVAVNSELESLNYSVTHELGTPVRSIERSSDALLEGHADKLNEDGKGHLEVLRSTSRRMRELVDDTLNLSRVLRFGSAEPAEIRREEVDLSAPAHTVAADLTEREPGRQVEFVIADGLVADGDPSGFGRPYKT